MNPEVSKIASVQSTLNLMPKPVMPNFDSYHPITHPQFIEKDFFAEKKYFTRPNPYDSQRMQSSQFRTQCQKLYYVAVLYDNKHVVPHHHINYEEMKLLKCFKPILGSLSVVGLLNFIKDVKDWNEQLILQFYATLHISGDTNDYTTWVLAWMFFEHSPPCTCFRTSVAYWFAMSCVKL